MVISLAVSPQLAPKPASKFRLLPEVSELNPGNPLLGYLGCFLEQNIFFFSKEETDKREKWQTMPLKDLPLAQLRNYGGEALRRADYAARLEPLDWQILVKMKTDGYRLLLPELQQMRTLGTALKVRFRGEVAERRFDAALVTARTMFALAGHLGEHPTLIGSLVGLAIANIALSPLDEMIAQPGCPNLYWALTDLPAPLVSIRRGLQGERMLFPGEFALDEKSPLSEAALQETIAKLAELLRFTTLTEGLAAPQKKDEAPPPPPVTEPDPRRKPRAFLERRSRDEGFLRAARTRLVESGIPEARLKQFPALQVVLLDEKLAYEVLRDERMKWMNLPFWQAEAALLEIARSKPENEYLMGALVPSVIKLRRAQARLEQRIALLRCVEALRLHAASHEGKLPARFADVKEPLPVDPITGKASLQGTPPKGEERNAGFNVRYEVTIRK
jgi:hypothetical protein